MSYHKYTDLKTRATATGAKLPVTLLNTCIK